MAITLPITSRTGSDDNTFQDVKANDDQLVAEFDDRDGNYSTLLFATTGVDDATTSAHYFLHSGQAIVELVSGGDPQLLNVPAPPLIYFDDADFAVASKTQKLRIRAQIAVNGTQPNVTFTVGLYPVTAAGGADALTLTLGTVVGGSTVAFSAPSANTISQSTSSNFTTPSDGAYALGVSLSAQVTANCRALVYGYLQSTYV